MLSPTKYSILLAHSLERLGDNLQDGLFTPLGFFRRQRTIIGVDSVTGPHRKLYLLGYREEGERDEGISVAIKGEDDQSGQLKERMGATDESQAQSPPQFGQRMIGNPPGFSGGKEETTISSTQSAWSQERQRYLNQSLALIRGSLFGGRRGLKGRFIGRPRREQIDENFDGTIPGMMKEFKRHFEAAAWAKERVAAKSVAEHLWERFARDDAEAERVGRRVQGKDLGDFLSHVGITDIAMKSVITDALESFWEDVLDHAFDEFEDGKSQVEDGSCAMIAIPITNRDAVITFDTADGDGRGDDIFGEVVSQSLSAGRDLALLDMGDKSFGVLLPGEVDVLFEVRERDVLAQHGEQMVLPFAVEHIEGDVGDVPPSVVGVNASAGGEDVEMRVVIAGTSGGLEHDDGTDVELFAVTGCFEHIDQTIMSGSHERGEQGGGVGEPMAEEGGNGQDDMAIGDIGEQSSADELHPSVGVGLCAGEAE